MDYDKSVKLALARKYVEVLDEDAYKGKYFIKDGMKWIHDIEALKRKLNIATNHELESEGYDVANYHKYKDYSNSMVDEELVEIYRNITQEDGEPTYLSDGMWLYPDGTIEEK